MILFYEPKLNFIYSVHSVYIILISTFYTLMIKLHTFFEIMAEEHAGKYITYAPCHLWKIPAVQ